MSPWAGKSLAALDRPLAPGLAARLVAALHPRPGQRFLDLASGTGTFFFPFFEAMGGRGVFLAAEWEEEDLRRFLNRLETYAAHPGYTRVEVLRAKPDRLPLPDRCADLALLAQDVLPRDLAAGIREWRRLLAPGGTLCLLGGAGTADAERAACSELAAVGFPWRVRHNGFEGHWCLTARL